MAEYGSVEMGPDAQDDFLGTGGTGVLSLSTAADTPPHSVPVSYGFDPSERVFYFRIAVGPDSDKGDLVERPVTFVTYGADGAGESYRSVVARGRLEPVEKAGIETETLAGLDRVTIPLFDVFDRPIRNLTFAFCRLVPEELTGREESRTRE